MYCMSPSIKSRLQYQHQTINELIEGLSEEQLRVRLVAGKWSAMENIAHLARYQEIFRERIDIICKATKPTFERYIAEHDPGFEVFVNKSLPVVLHSLFTLRGHIYQHLTLLTDTQILQVGVHPTFGILSISQWTEFFLLHEAHHLFTIFKLLSEFQRVR